MGWDEKKKMNRLLFLTNYYFKVIICCETFLIEV